MWRWFARWKSSWSAFFSAIFYDLRSLHSGKCLNTKTPSAFRWKRAFSTWISKFASFWLCFEQANWTRPREKLGYEVNILSSTSGTIDHCTILTLSPQRHLALIYCPDQPSNGQNLNILRGLLWALKLGLFSLDCYRRERDTVKLTAKRIINELGVAKFQGECLNISFWELWGGIIPFKITGEKLILKENKFPSANPR